MRLRKPKKRTGENTWLIYTFTVEGSYAKNIERPFTRVPDTFQYWITPHAAWDVRTFAIDQDVRVLRVDYKGRVNDPIGYFEDLAEETYSDIISTRHRIEAAGNEPVESLREKVRALGLFPHVEMTALGFPLWLPEHATYYSKSTEREVDDECAP